MSYHEIVGSCFGALHLLSLVVTSCDHLNNRVSDINSPQDYCSPYVGISLAKRRKTVIEEEEEEDAEEIEREFVKQTKLLL